MGWIRIHGGEVRCLGQVGKVPLVVMDGQSSLSPGHACFWLKSEIARACAQTVHGAYLSHPAAPAVQYQQQQYLSWRVNTFFRVATECMHALPCCEGEESASSSLLCTSPALSCSLSLFPHISHISYYANNLDILLFLFVLALPLAANGVPFAGM